MERSETRLVLASASPRRRELLERFSIPFEIVPAKGEEAPPEGPAPEELVKFLAAAKAEEVWRRLGDEGAVIVGADTVVVLCNQILGKPATREEAVEMLRALSGKTHHVITGVCLTTTEEQRSLSVTSEVTFKVLSDEEIDYYVDNYRPYDKAGAYGIQEWIGYVGVTGLKGSYFNVMGLPVQRIYQELADMFGTHELIRGGKALP